MSDAVSSTWAARAPCEERRLSYARKRSPWPTAEAACSSSIARGRAGSSISRMPRAIAPEVTITTRSPPCSSRATCSQTESSTSVRNSPSSAATIEEPSLTTRVMAGKVAEMGSALGWGALAASSLVIGAALSFARRWPQQQVGYVLAFGAGALISAVSFELAAEGLAISGAGYTGAGLAAGALTYYLLDGVISRRMATGRGRKGRSEGSGSGSGTALALGAFLDGIPEQLVLGVGIASGQGV